ncbi:MAG: hypothetical protein QG550_2105, partial [Pseudomonadota bacterium]|nr:hypothetical protein [Pseudomonadota bacterium]
VAAGYASGREAAATRWPD